MSKNYFTKQFYEEFTITSDFVKVVASNDELVLASCTVKAYDVESEEVSSSILYPSTLSVIDSKISGTKNALEIKIRGGAAEKSPYFITFYAATQNGEKWENDIKMTIAETGP